MPEEGKDGWTYSYTTKCANCRGCGIYQQNGEDCKSCRGQGKVVCMVRPLKQGDQQFSSVIEADYVTRHP